MPFCIINIALFTMFLVNVQRILNFYLSDRLPFSWPFRPQS